MGWYFTLDGRISLGQFWLRWQLPVIVISFLLGLVLGATTDQVTGEPNPAVAIIFLIFMLALIWPSIAVTVRRLHDIGWSGWFILLVLIPIANLVILVVTWFIPGTQGTNAYGSDPREAI